MATVESPPVRDEEDNEERDERNKENDQEGLKEEKEKLMMEILELQNTLHDLSQRLHAVKEENEQLQTDNQVILLPLTEITIKIISLVDIGSIYSEFIRKFRHFPTNFEITFITIELHPLFTIITIRYKGLVQSCDTHMTDVIVKY